MYFSVSKKGINPVLTTAAVAFRIALSMIAINQFITPCPDLLL